MQNYDINITLNIYCLRNYKKIKYRHMQKKKEIKKIYPVENTFPMRLFHEVTLTLKIQTCV